MDRLIKNNYWVFGFFYEILVRFIGNWNKRNTKQLLKANNQCLSSIVHYYHILLWFDVYNFCCFVAIVVIFILSLSLSPSIPIIIFIVLCTLILQHCYHILDTRYRFNCRTKKQYTLYVYIYRTVFYGMIETRWSVMVNETG